MNVHALLREAQAAARGKRARLRFQVFGGLTSEGSELAFANGRYYCPDPGEPFEEFAVRVSDAVDGPVVLGAMPDLPREDGAPQTRWKVEMEEDAE
jgi:hypothetical protein